MIVLLTVIRTGNLFFLQTNVNILPLTFQKHNLYFSRKFEIVEKVQRKVSNPDRGSEAPLTSFEYGLLVSKTYFFNLFSICYLEPRSVYMILYLSKTLHNVASLKDLSLKYELFSNWIHGMEWIEASMAFGTARFRYGVSYKGGRGRASADCAAQRARFDVQSVCIHSTRFPSRLNFNR